MRVAKWTRGLTCAIGLVSRNPHDPHSLIDRQELEQTPAEDLDLVFPEDDGVDMLEEVGLGAIPGVNYTMAQWEAGTFTQNCFEVTQGTDTVERAVGGQCTLEGLTVYNVTYTDCPQQPWVFCVCDDAEDTIDSVATNFGQCPVAARDQTAEIVLSGNYTTKDSESSLAGLAYGPTGVVIIFGVYSTVNLFVHEVSHLLDYWVAGKGEEWYSEGSEWHEVMDNDTCVADWYALSSYSEAYAQAAVMLAYDLNVGDVGEVAEDDACMSTAMDLITSQLEDFLTYYEDATCTMDQRWDFPVPWCVKEGQAAPCQAEANSTDSSSNNTTSDNDADADDDDDDSAGASNTIAMGTLSIA
ncbi:hypothetical protein S40293_10469, partial [Stachybotrys chartarum IBT 40293]